MDLTSWSTHWGSPCLLHRKEGVNLPQFYSPNIVNYLPVQVMMIFFPLYTFTGQSYFENLLIN
jgi:hypothetical protein